MASFKILKGISEKIPTELHEGYAYFTTDEGNLYIDISDTERVQVNAKSAKTLSGLTATVDELNKLDGVTSNIQTQLNGKANKSDIATTSFIGATSSTATYFKISDFGAWGTGVWYQKGFSMLIGSRAGELIWVSLSSNDSNTSARAIRLMNTHSKITKIYYSVSESAIYVLAAPWCNNISAHIISNLYGDYVPTVATASAVASDAVEINIVEFGVDSTGVIVGGVTVPLRLAGSTERPTYNGVNLAFESDVPTTTETWSFTLEDGTVVAKEVFVGASATETWTFTLEDGTVVEKGVYLV